MASEDAFLAGLIAEVREDPETLGLLLHGSRALDAHRADSDYDLIRIVTDEAYSARRKRDALHVKSAPDGRTRADMLYQTPSRIEAYVTDPGWYTATYISARILFDRTGAIAVLMTRLAAEAGKVASERTAAAYDEYLNGFVRSIKAARRGDDLGRHLHAAESALGLIRALFGLESAWPPYHDRLSADLTRIERSQGWPPGYLGVALLRLAHDADPTFQQELQGRVEVLMTARRIPHDWGTDLEPLKALRFEDPDGAAIARNPVRIR